MNVQQLMTSAPVTITPGRSLREAAEIMASSDIGILPVQENDRLVGMLSDRDIVVRGLAKGHGTEAPVRDAMTPAVRYCREDDDIIDVASNLGDEQIRRLPVLDRDKRLVGMLSLGDIARHSNEETAGGALRDVVEEARATG
ncbi:CBS domain-containing protein [Roseivivax sediminis]|uniref:CBS domain-containing protein n=1 Tax=Roseivivax sediminis TaxID=936889 RepID=A0A1I1VKL0_9RHOB|nr:CBS domain-containing protein [Roseivivax sediminis]SFD83612.1 CBS domain-containing protein [Roseivivax sediminis]